MLEAGPWAFLVPDVTTAVARGHSNSPPSTDTDLQGKVVLILVPSGVSQKGLGSSDVIPTTRKRRPRASDRDRIRETGEGIRGGGTERAAPQASLVEVLG
jgi:hypothetical protein